MFQRPERPGRCSDPPGLPATRPLERDHERAGDALCLANEGEIMPFAISEAEAGSAGLTCRVARDDVAKYRNLDVCERLPSALGVRTKLDVRAFTNMLR